MKGRFGKITESGLEDLERRIGVTISEPPAHVTEATRDAIRHYAEGIGDRNPLWLDQDYAQRTRWGTILAPPTILYAFSRICGGYVGGLPGVHAMFGGTDWEWFKPIRLGMRITPTSRLKALIDRPSKFAGRSVQQIYEVEFRESTGELIARADSYCFRTERDAARELGKYGSTEPHVYSEPEMQKIAASYEAERIRGARPRYFEDVEVGEELIAVVKGPMTPTTCIAYDLGWGGLYIRAHWFAFDLYRRHPALGIDNAQHVPEPPERVHWDNDMARQAGVPVAYDYGPERCSWMGHLVTNWIGDDGFMKKLSVQVRRHNLMGDTTWCHGKVTGKRREGGGNIVDCELWAENQRGETTTRGSATVALPSRP